MAKFSTFKRITMFLGKNISWFIISLGILGNLFIIMYFLKINRKNLSKMSLYHFLIIQLAVFDLITSVATSTAIMEFHEPTWQAGRLTCTIVVPLAIGLLPFVSCSILVLLSYERYRSITQPFAPKATKMKYSLMIAAIMLFGTAILVPLMMNGKLVTGTLENPADSQLRCGDGMRNFEAVGYVVYGGFLRILDCFVPAYLMYCFYRRIRVWMNADFNHLPLTPESKKRNELALRTLRNLIIIYIATVFPGRLALSALHADDNFRDNVTTNYFNFVHQVFTTLSLINNVVNVFVYVVMIKDFRRFLLTLITFGRI